MSVSAVPASRHPLHPSLPAIPLPLPPHQPHTTAATGAHQQQQPQPRVRQRKKPAPAIEPDSLYRGASSSSVLSHPTGPHPTPSHSNTQGTTAKRTLETSSSSQQPSSSEPRKRKRVTDSSTISHHHGPNSSLHGTPYATSVSATAVSHSAGGGGGSRVGGRHVSAVNMSDRNASGSNQATADGSSGDGSQSLFDFTTLPTSALYQYISQHGLEPAIYPRPLTADDPPPPGALLDPSRMGHRAPTPPPLQPMPMSRPRRAKSPSGTNEAGSSSSHRRRSMRLIEEQHGGGGGVGGLGTGVEQIPVLADVREVHKALAGLAQKHFQESGPVREVETLAAFMGAVRARGDPGRRFKVI